MQKNWTASLLELIRRTSADLPRDVERALTRARLKEKPASSARWALDTILENIRLARKRGAPLCQDTGALTFYCRLPLNFSDHQLLDALRSAIAAATRRGFLRENTLDSISGSAGPDNLGAGVPLLHARHERRRTAEIRLIMKGGGSENVGTQYSLPDDRLKAGRDLEGVRRCVLDAVLQAQGNGCAPGILGVGIGGDRSGGAECAKRQLLRPLGEAASDPRLARLEKRILSEANTLGIGPMGFGGATTLLDVKIGALSRLPASYFVSVAYMCWALRRRGVTLGRDGAIRGWLYQ